MSVRTIEVARGAWGGAMLLAPRWVLEHVHRVPVDRVSVTVARVLGARHLAQAALTVVSPGRDVLALGVWVDVAHAASMLPLVLDRPRARAGLTETVVALAWAATGLRDLRRAPTSHGRRGSVARLLLGLVPGGRVSRDQAPS